MKVLFVCTNNVARSQMAEAFFNRLSKGNQAISAGIHSRENGYEGKIMTEAGPNVTRVMAEAGYDVSKKVSKQLTEGMVKSADLVIYIAQRELIPNYVKEHKNIVYWNDLPDPRFEGYEGNLETSRAVRRKVEELIANIQSKRQVSA